MSLNYKNLILYYFSGTGNAAAVCRWAVKHAKTSGINTNIQSIDRIKTPTIPNVGGKTLLGFAYPTHGFFPAWSMLKFIIKFPKSCTNDIFLITTRGGTRIGNFLIPGLAGGSLYIPAILLKLKGYSIKGFIGVDLPISWTAFHPPLSPQSIKKIVSFRKPQVEIFIDTLISRHTYYEFHYLLYDLLVLPIGLLYLIAGRMLLPKALYASSNCNGCKICQEKCPSYAIKMKKGRPYWTWKCVSCMRCINICPQTAIQANYLYQILLYLIIIWYPFRKFIPMVKPFLIKSFGFVLGEIILSLGCLIFYFLLLIIIYRLLFYVLKSKIINNLFSITSYTKYYGRYKGPEEDSMLYVGKEQKTNQNKNTN